MRFCYSIYEKWFDSREDGIIEADNTAELSLILTEKWFQLATGACVPQLLGSSFPDLEPVWDDIMNENIDFCYWQIDENKSSSFLNEELKDKISNDGLDDFVLHYCCETLNPKI